LIFTFLCVEADKGVVVEEDVELEEVEEAEVEEADTGGSKGGVGVAGVFEEVVEEEVILVAVGVGTTVSTVASTFESASEGTIVVLPVAPSELTSFFAFSGTSFPLSSSTACSEEGRGEEVLPILPLLWLLTFCSSATVTFAGDSEPMRAEESSPSDRGRGGRAQGEP
jgi:hypothetical protein